MSRRTRSPLRCAAAALLCVLVAGCGGPTTGTATEPHDQDKKAGHMNYPAGGPNSPMAKAAAKKALSASK